MTFDEVERTTAQYDTGRCDLIDAVHDVHEFRLWAGAQ